MNNPKSVVGEADGALLNEYHQRRLRVTFLHIDSLITEVEHILVDSVSDSPFNRYSADATPIQQKIAHDYVLRIRAAMARIVKEQQIPFGEPDCGSRWAANTALLYAAVAVDELDPDRMRGYGQISDDGHNLLGTIGIELHSLIGKLQAFLAQGGEADLQRRIEGLEKGNHDVAPLEDLGRIITSYGLVTVDRIAVAWRNRSSAESNQILAATITELIANPVSEMLEEYYSLRKQAWQALRTAEKAFPYGLSLEMPAHRGCLYLILLHLLTSWKRKGRR